MIRFFWFCLVAIAICVINVDATIDSEALSKKLIFIKNSNNRRTGDPLPRPINVGNFSKNQKKLVESFKVLSNSAEIVNIGGDEFQRKNTKKLKLLWPAK
jgi:hypothetical protein